MKKTNKDIVPLAISIVLVLVSLWMWFIHSYVLEKELYFGILALVVATVLYFTAKKLYFYFFAFTLLAGLLGGIDFYYVTFKVGVGIISVNPIFIVLFVLYFGFSKDTMNTLFSKENKFQK